MGRAYGDDVHLPAAARRGPGPLPAHPTADRAARRDPHLNPGAAWVSNLSAEPEVFRAVLDDLLRPAQEQGLLQIRSHHRPVGAATDGDRVIAVDLEDSETDERLSVSASIVLDATEEGDLLPLAGCEFVVGAESARDTGEPHALDGPADPTDQQAITWCAALEWRPGENHTIERPVGYEFWRALPGRLLARTPARLGHRGARDRSSRCAGHCSARPANRTCGRFAGVRYGGHYVDPVPDVTLVNWPQVDYWLTPRSVVAPSQRADALAEARELTLSFVYWMQTEAPRPDGGSRLSRAPALPRGDRHRGRPGRGPVRPGEPPDQGRVHRAGEPCRREARPRARTGGRDVRRHGRRRLLPDRPPPEHGGTDYIDIATLPVPDPARRPAPAAAGEPARRRARTSASRTSPTAATGSTPSSGTSARRPGALAAFCLDRKVSPRAVRATPALLDDFQADPDPAGRAAVLAGGDPDPGSLTARAQPRVRGVKARSASRSLFRERTYSSAQAARSG